MKTTNILFLLFVFTGLISPGFLQAQVQVLTIQPGPSDGMDADIRTDLAYTSNGSSYDFIANAWTAQGSYFVQRSLIRFDLSQIPSNSTILNATLYLYTNLNTGHYQLDSGANASFLLRVLEPWIEQQVNWVNQPSASFEDPVILAQSTSNTQNYDVDVTSHVQKMVSNPLSNYGWLFRLQLEEKYRCMVFASSDNPVESWRPKLVISYRVCLLPSANFSFKTDTLTVHFTDQSTSAEFWNWDFGDGDTSNLQNPSHTYLAPGEYHVCLTIRDSCGSSTFCNTVAVTCQAPITGYSYAISNFTVVSFTDTSVTNGVASWFWDFGDGTTSSEKNPVHDYVNQGIFDACLTTTDPCGSDSYCNQIYCLLPMQVVFSTAQSEVNNLEVKFQDQSIGSTYWYWEFGDGDSSSEQNPTHIYKQYQLYQVCLTAGNDSMRSTLCDSFDLKFRNPGSIKNGVKLYPNPVVSSSFFLTFSSDHPVVNIFVTDSKGRIIEKMQQKDVITGNPIECKLGEIEPGVYIIKVIAGYNTLAIKAVFF